MPKNITIGWSVELIHVRYTGNQHGRWIILTYRFLNGPLKGEDVKTRIRR
jgi:hypothetical protein